MGSNVLRQGCRCGVVEDDNRRDGYAEAGRQGVAELDCTQGVEAGLRSTALFKLGSSGGSMCRGLTCKAGRMRAAFFLGFSGVRFTLATH